MQHPPRIQVRDDTRNSPAVGLLRISPAMLSLRLYPRLERLGWGGGFLPLSTIQLLPPSVINQATLSATCMHERNSVIR